MSRRDREEMLDTRVDLLRQRIKDSDDLKVKDDVFDTRTLLNLYDLANKGVIDALGGAVSTGKEANIFDAIKGDSHLIVKIYRVSTSDFRSMQDYLIGDPRFSSIKGTKRAIVCAWTKKEFRNLNRALKAGVRVPRPVAMKDNILVMEFIGCGEIPAPQLKDVDLEPEAAREGYRKLVQYVSDLYKKAELVHADLSEFNILYDGQPVIIDMGQSVTLDHPMAEKFLRRDAANLSRYFHSKYGIGSEDDILKAVRE